MIKKIDSNFWKDYAPLYSKFTPSNQKELLEYIALKSYKKVLDAGVGVGKTIPYLLNNSDVDNILGIDSNQFMLKEAKKKSNEKVKLLNLDINQVPKLGEKFNSILLTNVGYLIENPINFFQQSYSMLENGGKFIFQIQTEK